MKSTVTRVVGLFVVLCILIGKLQAQVVPFTDPLTGQIGFRNESDSPDVLPLCAAMYDSVQAVEGEYEEMFLVWKSGNVGIIAPGSGQGSMELRIPVQYKGVRILNDPAHAVYVVLLKDASERWALIDPKVAYGKGTFLTGFIIRDARLYLEFLWLYSDLGVTYLPTWGMDTYPITWYHWMHSFLGDRCPYHSGESILVRNAKGLYGFYYFEEPAICKYVSVTPLGDSCAAVNWLFQDKKGAYGFVTPYGDETYIDNRDVVPLLEMHSPHMVDRYLIPYKINSKDGQEWVGLMDESGISASPIVTRTQLFNDPKLHDFFNKEWFSDGEDYLYSYGIPISSTQLRPDLYWITFSKGKTLFVYLESNEQQINDMEIMESEYPLSEVRLISQTPNLLLASSYKGKGKKEWGVIDRGGSIFIEPLYDNIEVSTAADGTLRFTCTFKGVKRVFGPDGMEVE